jgi:hypothetical protein
MIKTEGKALGASGRSRNLLCLVLSPDCFISVLLGHISHHIQVTKTENPIPVKKFLG